MSNNKENKTKPNTLHSLLLETGFLLPTTEEEIEKYEKIFGNTDIILPQEVDNPDFIFKQKNESNSVNKKSAKIVSNDFSKNDYFKKLVLSAEIVNQLYSEPTFGRVKFVKITYLCEEVCNMEFSTNYGKYAAGPLDPKHIHSVDAEFKKRKWFRILERPGRKGYKYEPDINIEEYKKYYPRYFKNQDDLICQIIKQFRKQTTSFCEIVATLFFVWKKAISRNLKIDNELLIAHFYDWGEQKKKFSESELREAIEWMNNEKIVPLQR